VDRDHGCPGRIGGVPGNAIGAGRRSDLHRRGGTAPLSGASRDHQPDVTTDQANHRAFCHFRNAVAGKRDRMDVFGVHELLRFVRSLR
jgi:hypothetical protein